eukprot:scaffold248422_cov56-Cyclotella_meneghiniana.AAC.6
MTDTPMFRDHASTKKKSNPYTTGNSASQRTAQLNVNPIVLINESDRTLAAKSINRPRPNKMMMDAAIDIIASFVASLQQVPAQEGMNSSRNGPNITTIPRVSLGLAPITRSSPRATPLASRFKCQNA